jgi:hypothetical protein
LDKLSHDAALATNFDRYYFGAYNAGWQRFALDTPLLAQTRLQKVGRQ